MAHWSDLQAQAPELAARGWELLARGSAPEGLLATVRSDGLLRIHPVNVGIVDGRLMTFIQGGSAKARDLAADGRYALHAHVDPAEPHEFLVRGRGRVVTDGATRAVAAADWSFEPDPSYPLIELDIEHALFGERGPDEWPPRYTSWRL